MVCNIYTDSLSMVCQFFGSVCSFACVCIGAHLKYCAAPVHLFSTCSTCIWALLVFGFVSPCRRSLKDMHPCVSGSPLLDPPRVDQHCKWIDLWAPMCGHISQNTRFGGGVHWEPHCVGSGNSRERDGFLGATSLLAVLHRIFLADKLSLCSFLVSSHSRLQCSITMNETIVLHTNVVI